MLRFAASLDGYIEAGGIMDPEHIIQCTMDLGPSYANGLKKLKRSSTHLLLEGRTQIESDLPAPLRIKDIGDVFNWKYLINWEEDDPRDFYEHCNIPIEQDQAML